MIKTQQHWLLADLQRFGPPHSDLSLISPPSPTTPFWSNMLPVNPFAYQGMCPADTLKVFSFLLISHVPLLQEQRYPISQVFLQSLSVEHLLSGRQKYRGERRELLRNCRSWPSASNGKIRIEIDYHIECELNCITLGFYKNVSSCNWGENKNKKRENIITHCRCNNVQVGGRREGRRGGVVV